MIDSEGGDRATESGWEEHCAEQRRAWLRLDYRQRLEWLESAKRFAARALAAARERRRGGDSGSGGRGGEGAR